MAQIEQFLSGEEVYTRFIQKLTEITDVQLAHSTDAQYLLKTNEKTKVHSFV